MSTTEISPEAVEAAANGISNFYGGHGGPTYAYRRLAKTAISSALPILRAQFAEDAASAWDCDRSLFDLIEERMYAAQNADADPTQDADAVQDIGTNWLRNYGAMK